MKIFSFLIPYWSQIKLGIFFAGLLTIGLLYWRADYLADKNAQLSATILAQEQTIKNLKALSIRRDTAAKKDAERTIANGADKMNNIIEIERMTDEKNAPLAGGFNDLVERLWSDRKTD